MNNVLTVFIDGLNFDNLKHMPFLASLCVKQKIYTELGYSIACHPSMYTGVHPNKHLIWFTWKYSPQTSPFRAVEKFGLHKLPHHILLNYLYYRMSVLGKNNSAYFHIPFLGHTPLKNWHYFDVSEKKLWTESNYSENYPTIFEILNQNHIASAIVGVPSDYRDSLRIMKSHNRALRKYNPTELKPWTYFFIGDVDPMSHWYGQDSNEVSLLLREIDTILEQKYRFFQNRVKDFTFMLFSDHGLIRVQEEINISDIFKSLNKRLDDYIYAIESNYARFWFRNSAEEKDIRQVLSKLDDKGFVLTRELLREYNVDMPDNRYGDLIFYLDAPRIFDRGKIYLAGKRLDPVYISMHGYRPDVLGYEGVLVSNKPIKKIPYVKLVDIVPSILSLLDIPIPPYVEGASIWK
jgi:predicted AlkP superfamily pyrophosphatase or phosphodiesterase